MNVLFDLDGTLTDPGEGITRTYQYALERLGRPVPTREDLLPCIGPPLRVNFARMLETDDPETIERAVGIYRERYAPVGVFENEVYDGVFEMLDRVRAAHSPVLVATAKPLIYALQVVEHHGLSGHVDGVYGPDLDGKLDDKADLLAHLLADTGLDPAATVMVGDRAGDVRAALLNGVRSVGVTYGYGSREELLDAGAHFICATPLEVAGLLERLHETHE